MKHIALTGVLAALFFASAAMAADEQLQQDTQQIKTDRQEIKADTQEIHQDRHALHQAKKEHDATAAKEAKSELHKDKKERRHDTATLHHDKKERRHHAHQAAEEASPAAGQPQQ